MMCVDAPFSGLSTRISFLPRLAAWLLTALLLVGCGGGGSLGPARLEVPLPKSLKASIPSLPALV